MKGIDEMADLDSFLGDLRKQIENKAKTLYRVSPPQAYAQAGFPRGPLVGTDYKCIGCGLRAHAYSGAGLSEVKISGMCEPCFDFSMLDPDDREKDDEWMSLVEYNKKDD